MQPASSAAGSTPSSPSQQKRVAGPARITRKEYDGLIEKVDTLSKELNVYKEINEKQRDSLIKAEEEMARIRTINKSLHARVTQTQQSGLTPNTGLSALNEITSFVNQERENMALHKTYLEQLSDLQKSLGDAVATIATEKSKTVDDMPAQEEKLPNEEETVKQDQITENKDQEVPPVLPPHPPYSLGDLSVKLTLLSELSREKLPLYEKTLSGLSDLVASFANIETLKQSHQQVLEQYEKEIESLNKSLEEKELISKTCKEEFEKEKSKLESQITEMSKDLMNQQTRFMADEDNRKKFGEEKVSTLEKQIQVLENVVASNKTQFSTLQNSLEELKAEKEKLKADQDIKMKKLKTLFESANKTVSELRQSVTDKEVEIEKLTSTNALEKENQKKLEVELESCMQNLTKLTQEIDEQAAIFSSQTNDSKAKTRQLMRQLKQKEAEFNEYKLRTHSLLMKKEEENNNARIVGLEESNLQLMSENRLKTKEANDLSLQLDQLTKDFAKACERIMDLEHQRARFQRIEEELKIMEETNNQLGKLLDEEKESSQKALALQTETLARFKTMEVSNQAMNDELERLREKIKESELLSNEMEKLRKDNEKLRNEIERKNLKIQTAIKVENQDQGVQQVVPEALTAPASSRHPVQPITAYSEIVSGNLNIDREKDYESQIAHLVELLNESEMMAKKLKEQQKVLKDELRRTDTSENLHTLEYLKNVFFKFLNSAGPEKDHMIGAISSVLRLTKDENAELVRLMKQKDSRFGFW